MPITRSTPNVGYLDPALINGAGVSQIVRANDTVYFSGIVAARKQGECVAPNDFPAQLRFILATLNACLEAEGLTFQNLVATTWFCKDIVALSGQVDILASAFRGHPPTSTWVEVSRLADPDYLIELVAIAVVG